MITPGNLFKMGSEIVAGLREILGELKQVRGTIDRGLGELLGQMKLFTERLDSMNEQIDRAMAMLTSVVEDESVLAEGASAEDMLKRAAAAARSGARGRRAKRSSK
jgi:hypothetical protein